MKLIRAAREGQVMAMGPNLFWGVSAQVNRRLDLCLPDKSTGARFKSNKKDNRELKED